MRAARGALVLGLVLSCTGCLFDAIRGRDGGSRPARKLQVRTLEDQKTKLELRLLERDTQIERLQDELAAQRRMLDEAILEVVRTKAKLHSLESKAEAASALAEAEIALKAVTARAGERRDPELLQARQLLEMGAAEFDTENFGGALYLTSQAKSHIQKLEARLDGGGPRLEPLTGEVPFEVPLPMATAKGTNLRQGPGLEFDVLATLDGGAPVTAHSYVGEWVHVTTGSGTTGWVHQGLIQKR